MTVFQHKFFFPKMLLFLSSEIEASLVVFHFISFCSFVHSPKIKKDEKKEKKKERKKERKKYKQTKEDKFGLNKFEWKRHAQNRLNINNI